MITLSDIVITENFFTDQIFHGHKINYIYSRSGTPLSFQKIAIIIDDFFNNLNNLANIECLLCFTLLLNPRSLEA
jgi:hypothetical protein